MRIFATGYKGNVGSRLVKSGIVEPLECDVTKEAEVQKAIKYAKPDVIIHLAGKTDVNWCEKPENQESVEQNNQRGSAIVFKCADDVGAKVIYISSDHIFSGIGFGGYTENSKPNPKNFYGLSKLTVEATSVLYDNVKIIRTSTLFWKERSLVKSQLDLLKEGKVIHPPAFMYRSFMHIDHFIDNLIDYTGCAFDAIPKVLNLSGSKVVSWPKFITTYAQACRLWHPKLVHPRYVEDNNKDFAPRPKVAGLSTRLSEKLGFIQYDYLDGILYDS